MMESQPTSALKTTFGAKWIRCGELVSRLPPSPDLLPLDNFLGGHLKNLVHETPLDSDEDPVAHISEALHVCGKCLASLNVYTNRSTDAVTRGLLLLDAILNSYYKHYGGPPWASG